MGTETARASRELAAIVGSTEQATQSILQAAEEIDQAANALSASVKGSHDQGLAHDVQDRVVQIFEACNFQDLTGQRVSHVLETLKFVEEHAPLRRNVTTDEVGNVAAFLLSDLASAVTGEILYVDSGFSQVVGGMAVATSSPDSTD